MTSTGDTHDDADLAALREEIDELKKIPEEELIAPPIGGGTGQPTPAATDAPGSEDWEETE